MGSQGFRNIAGNPFVYQEDTRSAAFGLDAAAQKWKLSVKATTGALPTDTAQLTIDPATNGDVTVDPNGAGSFVVTSGDLSLTAGGITLGNGKITNIYGQTVGATNGLVQIDNSNRLGSTNSPSVTGSITAGTDIISTAGNLKLPNSTSTVGQIMLNSVRYFHNYGNYGADGNLFFGRNAGNFTLTTSSTKYNTAFGNDALAALTAAATSNVAIGQGALNACQTGINNCALGALYPIGNLTSGNNNFGLGTDALRGLLTGSYNIAIGVPYNGAGRALTGSESSNIYFNNEGVAGESGVLRIGRASGETPGGGQLSKAYIHGIYGVTPGGTQNIALINSNGQLGSTATLSPTYGGAMTWTEVTGTSQAAAVNNGYITNNVALVTVTLPSTAAVGQRVRIGGKGAGLWKLAQNSGQVIHFGSIDTTTGTGGYLAATVKYDTVEVICITANTDWLVLSSVGSLTIV